MKKAFSQHPAFILFHFVVGLLLIGLTMHSGFKHWDKIALMLASLYVVYFTLCKLKPGHSFLQNGLNLRFKVKTNMLNLLLLIITLALVLIDIIVLKGLPGYRVFSIETTREFSDLRAQIHENSHPIFVYLSGFSIKAILPFAILHFFALKKWRIYYLLLILAALFGFGMMQKSFVLVLILPVLVYALAKKKYWHALLHAMVVVVTIFALTLPSVYLKNVDPPPIINNKPAKTVVVRTDGFFSKLYSSVKGISNRVFVIPGEIMSKWFEAIPSKKPFLDGDGYSFIAKMKGHQYRNYEKELYAVFFPHEASIGYEGSVNAATFVREYANFGYIGLVVAGILLAFAFYILAQLFTHNTILFMAINLFPIFILSSGNILTILFSGGWGLSILLFFVFKKQYEPNNTLAL